MVAIPWPTETYYCTKNVVLVQVSHFLKKTYTSNVYLLKLTIKTSM